MVELRRVGADAVPARFAASIVWEIVDADSGLQAFLAIADPTRGAAFGGIRRRAHAGRADAIGEALRLADQMSLKTRFAGLACGGAKTVIRDHADLDRAGAYRALGDAVAALDGAYVAGPDVGTTEADLDLVRERTTYVNAAENDPGGSTARGVLGALRACLVHRFGSALPRGRRFAVQGLGSVGLAVAAGLARGGARLEVADLDATRVRLLEREVGDGLVRTVPCDAVLRSPVDAALPCALGPVVDEASLATLGAGILCGSANDQLARPELALALHRRDVLWAPDFAVNGGAVIEGVIVHRSRGASDVRERVDLALEAIGPRLLDVLRTAAARDVPPVDVARERL